MTFSEFLAFRKDANDRARPSSNSYATFHVIDRESTSSLWTFPQQNKLVLPRHLKFVTPRFKAHYHGSLRQIPQ